MIARIRKYFREIRLEWEKVSKPDWKDVRGNTLVVIVACAMIGLYLWIIDGNPDYPNWTSELGIALLAVLIPIVVLIAKRYTPKWKISIPISIVPLAIAMFFRFGLEESVKGFGLALLRDLFIRR
jgi:preprotein translocase SecE subunit